jgi:hypothetical protein
MPVPQENSLFVEQASCLFIKSLLRMVQHLNPTNLEMNAAKTSEKSAMVVNERPAGKALWQIERKPTETN